MTLVWLVSQGFVAERTATPHLDRLLWTIGGLPEYHLGGNHLLRSLIVAATGAAITKGFRIPAVTRLRRAIGRQFLASGMHYERCPAYHRLALWELEFLRACAPGLAATLDLGPLITRGRSVLARFTHEDGCLTAFGDSAPSSMTPTSPKTGKDSWCLADAGFAYTRRDAFACWIHCGPMGAPEQPGHAHCDLLSCELDFDGVRVVVDPGIHSYHDPYWRQLCRSSAAHNGPHIPGIEQAECWGSFRCGWRPRQFTLHSAPGQLMAAAVVGGPNALISLERQIDIAGDRIVVTDRSNAGSPQVMLTLAPSCTLSTQLGDTLIQTPRGVLALRTKAAVSHTHGFVSHRFCERLRTNAIQLQAAGRSLQWSLVRPT